MAGSEAALTSATAEDLPAVAALIRAELGEDTTSEDLRWWFFDNPARGASVEVARDSSGVVGMATVNDCIVSLGCDRRRFGMPQKVLVAGALRGQGLFGRLYRRSEESSLARGVAGFLTFTNAASTPIFLSKFGYRRGRCPDVLVFPWNPAMAIGGPSYRVEQAFPEEPTRSPLPQAEGALCKDWEYFRWRYSAHRAERFTILSVGTAGWAVLKSARKGGLPVTLLMDSLPASEAGYPLLLDAALRYSACRGSVALLALVDCRAGASSSRRMHLRVKDRFNFLVKGPDDASTKNLAEMAFSFTFGDLDFT